MNIQIRQIPDKERYKGLTTQELRDGYLLSEVFKKGEINFNYIDLILLLMQIKHSMDTPGASHEDVLLLGEDEDIADYCWTLHSTNTF